MKGAPPARRVAWRKTYRIIPSRYPPIALFERVADPADWDGIVEIESLTNERIRDEIGEIARVPPEQRVSGPGASWVMAAFVHAALPSRFSDGSYGVYYTAHTRDCAIAETTYHWGRFLAATSEPATDVTMRVLVASLNAALHDIRRATARYRAVYARDDYTAGQALGRALRSARSNGIVYDSVRLAKGECAAAFRPRVISRLPDGNDYLVYHWSGARIERVFDYENCAWATLS
ncbi:MAG TPA: RES family NAD+ phosphorylase [Gammaproteobacteria bacterium]|nr:RES family NAD+ phosphorylase [Gammaproteobacteria bacterium]